MTHRQPPCLPDPATWRFDRIRADDPERADALEAAGSPEELLRELGSAFERAADRGDTRFGREHAHDERGGCRAVIQFHVGSALFDWFFNARTGYRAHFRSDPCLGQAFNDRIVEAVRVVAQRALPEVVDGRELIGKFEDGGSVSLQREFLRESLVPTLSKVWWC